MRSEPVNHRTHTAALVGGGALAGAFLARRHHPLVWLALAALVVGVVALAVMVWPAALAALVIVTATRARSHRWPAARYALTFGSWLGALVLVVVGAALAGFGGALVALAVAFGLWHTLARPYAHSLQTKGI
jgi:hypothetical protein